MSRPPTMLRGGWKGRTQYDSSSGSPSSTGLQFFWACKPKKASLKLPAALACEAGAAPAVDAWFRAAEGACTSIEVSGSSLASVPPPRAGLRVASPSSVARRGSAAAFATCRARFVAAGGLAGFTTNIPSEARRRRALGSDADAVGTLSRESLLSWDPTDAAIDSPPGAAQNPTGMGSVHDRRLGGPEGGVSARFSGAGKPSAATEQRAPCVSAASLAATAPCVCPGPLAYT